ncbi:hypothetical protein ACVBEH_04710 [Roseateles sp. GG27B]
MQLLEQQEALSPFDLLRANVFAKLVLDAWIRCGLSHSDWQLLRAELHEEFSLLLGEAYHEVNRRLIAEGVLPEVDLRPFIRRAVQGSMAPLGNPKTGLLNWVHRRFRQPSNQSRILVTQAGPVLQAKFWHEAHPAIRQRKSCICCSESLGGKCPFCRC